MTKVTHTQTLLHSKAGGAGRIVVQYTVHSVVSYGRVKPCVPVVRVGTHATLKGRDTVYLYKKVNVFIKSKQK